MNNLALLSIERELLEHTDLNSVIDNFAALKARKIDL